MATSDVENLVSESGSCTHVAGPTPGFVRDLNSFLSIARKDVAPLESSDKSNLAQRCDKPLNAMYTKSREEFIEFSTGGVHSKPSSIDQGWAHDASMSVDTRRQPAGVHFPQYVGDLTAFSDEQETVLDLNFDRHTVEDVENSFRELFGPKQAEDSNFFEEIIDVDSAIGFGEDEDFVGQKMESSDISRDSSASPRNLSSEDCTSEEGRKEDQLKSRIAANVSRSEGELDEIQRESKERQPTSSDAGCCRESPGNAEDFVACEFPIQHEWRRNLSNQCMLLTDVVNQEDEKMESETLRHLAKSPEEPVDSEKEWLRALTDIESGRRQRDYRSREVGSEDEVGMRKRSRVLDRRYNGGLGSKNSDLQQTLDKVVSQMPMNMKQEKCVQDKEETLQEQASKNLMLATKGQSPSAKLGNPYHRTVGRCEELLREAVERIEREKKIVADLVHVRDQTEESMRQQQMRWSKTEKKLESKLSTLEMQHSRLLDVLGQTTAALTIEKDRRKNSRIEESRILEVLICERKSHQDTAENLSTCVNSLMKLRGNLAMQKSRSTEDGGPSCVQVVETILRDMDRELQINLSHLSKKTSEADTHTTDMDELSRWKKQRDAIEAERDRVEESMSSLLRKTRESHEEMETLWLERESLLEQKVGFLEIELQHSEMKLARKEAEILAARRKEPKNLQQCSRASTWVNAGRESSTQERAEVLEAVWNSKPDSFKENCSFAKVGGKDFWEISSEISDSAAEELDSVSDQRACQEDHAKQRECYCHGDVPFDDKINQLCIDVGDLAVGMEAGVEKETEKPCSMERQWEIERTEWKSKELLWKKQHQQMEQKISELVAAMEKLNEEVIARKAEMESYREQMEVKLAEKNAEMETANLNLKSKEHDMEVTVQKFMDEVRLIDQEVEKERQEREQVMELHFASKRKLVQDMKVREEKWEREIVSTNEALKAAQMEVRHKERELEDLSRSSTRAPTEKERELSKVVSTLQHEKDSLAAELSKEKHEVRRAIEEILADVWKVCQDQKVEAAVAKRLGPGDEQGFQSPLWEHLWVEYFQNKVAGEDTRVSDWQVAVERIGNLNEENSQAMSAIDTLREELELAKNKLLVLAAEKEGLLEEIETRLADDQQKEKDLLHSQKKETELAAQRLLREKELCEQKESMEKLHKQEKNELFETISSLQGMVRELEWELKQSKGLRSTDESEGSIGRRSLTQSAAKNVELVKVQASYLEDMDRYILELEAKMEASENTSSLSGHFSKRDRKWAADSEMNLALMKIEKELFCSPGSDNRNSLDAKGSHCSSQGTRDLDISGHGHMDFDEGIARTKMARHLDRNMCLTLNGVATLPHDRWAEETDEHLPLWQIDDRNSISSWMSPRSLTEVSRTSFELSAHGGHVMPCASPSTALKRQQKWMVDVSWLEQVRKEHTWLRQQLEIERQRVAALGRVEADNRWIEGAIFRALELKRESDSKVADMQRKVNIMEILVSKKNPIRSSS